VGERSTYSDLSMQKEKIIITMTSWKNRICNIPMVIASILSNTMLPDKIVINLSEEEFVDKVLPEQVQQYIDLYDFIEVYWVGANTKVWKKIIPTLKRFPNDVVICIDDDKIYPSNFIKVLYNTHLMCPNNPIATTELLRFGAVQHCGSGTLDKAEFYGDMLKQKEPIDMVSSDTYFNYWAQKSGHPVVSCSLISRKFDKYNDNDAWSRGQEHLGKMWEYCVKTYGEVERHKPNIFYTIPFDTNKNIGAYYNKFAALIPKDAYVCFVDGDTLFTTPDYGELIEDAIIAYPYVDAFTCVTNRVNCKWQIAKHSDWNNDNIVYHRKFGNKRKEKCGNYCIDMTNDHLFSGLFLLMKKSAWDKIGGANEKGMLGVDNDIHDKIRKMGMNLYKIMGLYLYHWYRGGDKKDVKHLI